MRLLIVTQVIDKNHPILGFFHRWIEEFAKNCETVHVICLHEGEHYFPKNVHVYSLGKEKRPVSSVLYAFRLNILSWKLRKEYDSVFVHMNPEYTIAGYLTWLVFRKKIGMWYAHGAVSLKLRLATLMSTYIFTSTPEGFRIDTQKRKIVGQGIDTVHFAPNQSPKDIDLISVGRISRTKNLHALVDVLALVRKEHDVSLTLVGDTATSSDLSYKTELIDYIQTKDLAGYVHFVGPATQTELPSYLNRARVFVHTAKNGSLDKSILEALSCWLPVVTSADGVTSLPLGDWIVHDLQAFAQQTSVLLDTSDLKHSQMLRDYVKQHHSITSLVHKICHLYT